jgi:hypothetical protein
MKKNEKYVTEAKHSLFADSTIPQSILDGRGCPRTLLFIVTEYPLGTAPG